MSETAFDAIRQIMDTSGVPSKAYMRIVFLLNEVQEAHGQEVDRLKRQIKITTAKRYLTKSELAEALDISKECAARLWKRDDLPKVRKGLRRYADRVRLMKLLRVQPWLLESGVL